MAGRLFAVATPIGDLQDLSPRALSVLRDVPLVAAEDTRVARKLYRSLDLEVPELWSCHEHNEQGRAGPVVQRLAGGDDVALVSDAGTPLVSDPGYRVVQAVLSAGLEVVPVPGPCAPVAALVASGLATDRFLFAGFPPSKSGKRKTWLGELAGLRATVILFESPRRIVDTLLAAHEAFGERRCCLAISLTKEWERFHRGSLADVAAVLQADPDEVIGEMTLCIGGQQGPVSEDPRVEAVIDALAASGVAPSVIRDAISKPFGVKGRWVYQRALAGRLTDE
jgi:16S rRNA (cytidine1402-2'-O)-methyltransferase